MPIFDSLQHAQFDGVPFPVKSVAIELETRYHEHIYLKAPGAATEKMSRGLYRITMEAVFDANIRTLGTLWPNSLAALRNSCERQVTTNLIIPTVGTIQAWLPKISHKADFTKVRSGETATLTFMEDSTQLTLTEALVGVKATTLASAASKFNLRAEEVDPSLNFPFEGFADRTPSDSIFTQIQNATNAVFAIKDQGDLFGNLVLAKISTLLEILREADRDVKSLQDSSNFAVVDALHELMQAAIELGRDIQGKRGSPHIYHVPSTMSVSQISAAVYGGDGSHGSEIMQNNSLPNPFAVPAGEEIIYFPLAA